MPRGRKPTAAMPPVGPRYRCWLCPNAEWVLTPDPLAAFYRHYLAYHLGRS